METNNAADILLYTEPIILLKAIIKIATEDAKKIKYTYDYKKAEYQKDFLFKFLNDNEKNLTANLISNSFNIQVVYMKANIHIKHDRGDYFTLKMSCPFEFQANFKIIDIISEIRNQKIMLLLE